MKEIISTHKQRIQSLIVSMTGTRNAQDIEQEVYIKVWKNLSGYRAHGNIWSWIKKITVNTCKDHLKSKQFNKDRKTDFDDESYSQIKDNKLTPEVQVLMSERQKQIVSAIETLKPKLKEVVILYDIKDMSYEEISDKLKCPVGTVKSRLFNARKQLQIELEERSIL